MATKSEKKPAVGRKRKYPEGSIEHRLKLPPDVQESLQAYIDKQEVKPDDGMVLLLAVKEFLTTRGLYK